MYGVLPAICLGFRHESSDKDLVKRSQGSAKDLALIVVDYISESVKSSAGAALPRSSLLCTLTSLLQVGVALPCTRAWQL
jgi:hypothetical protein